MLELQDVTKEKLKKMLGVVDDVDFEIQRPSKFALDISLCKGLALYGKVRINARTGKIKRLV